MTVRISEIYASIQGEGPRTGMGTIFLRFGGCNLRCPGWPCDTIFAIDPKFRNEWTKRSTSDTAAEVFDLADDRNIANVCLTGGEPFLQPHDELKDIVDFLIENDINVEAFSNGQIAYPDWAFNQVDFVMDWKLNGSGNPATGSDETLALQKGNIAQLKPTDGVKLVIKHMDDFKQAREVWMDYHNITAAQWWAGVVWEGSFREADLVELIQKYELPWNLNVQTHKYLWKPEARGV